MNKAQRLCRLIVIILVACLMVLMYLLAELLSLAGTRL